MMNLAGQLTILFLSRSFVELVLLASFKLNIGSIDLHIIIIKLYFFRI